jgi:uncharacterized protein
MDLESVPTLARAALRNLEAHRRRIDDLNVYPVPDGDTGTNLVLTVRSVVEALDRIGAGDPTRVAGDASRAALLSARGNSGVILSQIVRGFADGLHGDGELPQRLARAFRSASDFAYKAVREPAEGTMLTAIREMADEAEERAAAGSVPVELLRAVVVRGDLAVARSEEMLEVLRQAGVVDAGAAGLVEIVRGVALEAAGEPLPESPVEPGRLAVEAIHQELSRYRYCTTFLVEGEELDREALERRLERLGDSLLVVGDGGALKAHVHTDDPGAALSAGTAIGVIDGVEIANMHLQSTAREERLLARPSVAELTTALVAVAQGAGNKRLFEDLGASLVVEGGETMNPSAAEIVAAIEAVPASDVVVLPNNPNVLMTAEQAGELASKRVRVVRSTSIQAGFAAAVRFLGTSEIEENEAAMREALVSVSTGEVTVASRDAQLNGVAVRRGQFFGLSNGAAVAADDVLEDVLLAVVERMLAPGQERLDLILGEGAPPVESVRAAIELAHPDLHVEVYEGGQPHHPVLVVSE